MIKDIGNEKVYPVSLDLIRKHFLHGYCRTCHSYQGSTIKDEITIFDWNFFYVSRKWIYTAITRTTDLKNVFIYNGKCEEYNETLLDSYLMKKISQYKKQDKDANRPISNNYVDIKWFKNCFGKNCSGCGNMFNFTVNNRNEVSTNLTADREDCSDDHHLYNIVPLCILCNCSKSNKK